MLCDLQNFSGTGSLMLLYNLVDLYSRIIPGSLPSSAEDMIQLLYAEW